MPLVDPPGTTRTPAQRLKDQALVAELYLAGMSTRDIAKRIGYTQAMVKRDMRHVRKRWKERADQSMDMVKHQELARVDKVEKQAWEEWERSKEPTTRRTARKTKEGKEVAASITTIEQTGDPRYLAIIDRCMERRLAIMDAHSMSLPAQSLPECTKEWVTATLQKIAHMALRPGDSQNLTAGIRAVELLGKELGMFIDRRLLGVGTIDNMNEDELLELLGGEPEPTELDEAASTLPPGHA